MKKTLFAALGLWIIGLGIVPSSFSETITFLHSNDTHGIFKPYKIEVSGKERLVGGMEALSHYVNEIRAREKNVVLIDAGDMMTGTLATSIEYQSVVGGAMIEFMNRLNYDIWSFGNHEFDRGPLKALSLARLARFPVVMANVIYKDSGKLFASGPYRILNVAGLKVGIIGVMEENFLEEVHRERIKELDVLPIIPTLNSYIPVLEKQADLIVVLVHAGFNEGMRAAKEVPGVDIVFTASEDGKFKEVNGVLVQSTIGHQQTLGYLKIEFEKGKIVNYKENLVWLWADVPLSPSPKITELVVEMDTLIGREYTKVIGEAKNDLTTTYLPMRGSEVECNLGDWITDVMRWKTGVQIGFHNSGAIRADIHAGPVTIAQIFEVCPFRNTLVIFKLTGQQIKDALEHDVERGMDRMQVSGLKYKYYPKEEKPLGERIYSVVINGEVLVKKGEVLFPQKVFTVVSNDYLVVQAKDKYFGFPVENHLDTKMPLDQVLIEWIEKNKVIDSKIEKRIVKITK